MKSMLRPVDLGNGVTVNKLAFCCPGCAESFGGDGFHMVNVNSNVMPSWNWDENLDAPTLSPSLLTESRNADGPTRCHSFLQAGVFNFLDDCTHSLAGTSVPMPDLPDWVVNA